MENIKDALAALLVVFGVLVMARAPEDHSTLFIIIGSALLTFGIHYTIDRGRVW